MQRTSACRRVSARARACQYATPWQHAVGRVETRRRVNMATPVLTRPHASTAPPMSARRGVSARPRAMLARVACQHGGGHVDTPPVSPRAEAMSPRLASQHAESVSPRGTVSAWPKPCHHGSGGSLMAVHPFVCLQATSYSRSRRLRRHSPSRSLRALPTLLSRSGV